MIPWAGHVNYAASQGGMKLFMQSLAQELAPHRIRVNSVAPGAIPTPINRAAWQTPTALKSLLELIPYGRIGQPEDIGRTVAWLASDDARLSGWPTPGGACAATATRWVCGWWARARITGRSRSVSTTCSAPACASRP
jgi:NAD(P)-dependent dehydrogenase (short-subunit alcohol dehydrogenase family)